MRITKKLPDWVIGLVVTVVILFITLTGVFDFTAPIEMKTFDLRAGITASGDRNPDIELVVISDNDISELGAFPWPRDILGQCIDNIAHAGAKVIALNILLSEPQESPGLNAVRRLHSSYEISGLAQQGPGLVFYKELSKALTDLDNDSKLRKALEKAGNVVLPVWFDTRSSGRDSKVPDFVSRYAFERIEDHAKSAIKYELRWFSKLGALHPSFADVAAGIGHMNIFEDQDGCVRNQNHVIGYLKDMYFPSFSLASVMVFKNLKNKDITIALGDGINLRISSSSVVKVPVGYSHMSTPIKWNGGPAVAFRQTPFVKVLKNKVETSIFKDKIVIIGATATGIGAQFATPISGNLPDIEIVANSISNILNRNFISRPGWLPVIESVILLLFGLFIAFILPRLNTGQGAFITFGLIIASGGTGTALLLYSNIWLKIAPSIVLLILGYLLLISKCFLNGEKEKKKVVVELPEMDMEPLPTFERYELMQELGKGESGVVYKAHDIKTKQVVAIKAVILEEFGEGVAAEMKARFFRGIESAGLLTHPSIATIYDFGEDQGLAYVAMEYVEGMDLRHYISPEHLLPLRETLDITARVADALDYVHSKGIIHGNIKPANIMWNKETRDVKIIGFGIAGVTPFSRHKKDTGPDFPYYISPEQLSGKKTDGRSDVFSVGVLLFEMLTGQKPFTGEDISDLMLCIARDKHPSAKALNHKVPRIVEGIIDRALEKDLNKRYQSAGQMAGHLRKVVDRIDDILAQKRAGF